MSGRSTPVRSASPPPPPPAQYRPLQPALPPVPGLSWSKLAKLVRRDDEAKVEDAQGDIDVALIFAGLFSVVLSVFLLVSFNDLRVDIGAETVALLRQISAQTQTFSVSESFISSTAPTPDHVDFEPRSSAVAVNVLWCASLTINLVGASLGLLVKQWLRAYLSLENYSATAKLRVRHLRNRDVSDWKVFTIASFVPIMLQLSLGLFLAGLCVFTAQSNKESGYTTFGIAIGWAVVLLFTIVAPILSPRCPYKLPILIPFTPHVRRLIEWTPDMSEQLLSLTGNSTSIDKADFEDKDAALANDMDLDVLVSIFTSHGEEELITTMANALHEAHASPEKRLEFIQRIIQTFQPSEDRKSMLDKDSKTLGIHESILSLNRLPANTYSTIMTVTSDVLYDEIVHQTGMSWAVEIKWSACMKDALRILLSGSSYPMPNRAIDALFSCINGPRRQPFAQLLVEVTAGPGADTVALRSSNVFAYIVDRLNGVLADAQGADVLPFLYDLVCCSFYADEEQPSHGQLFKLFTDNKPDVPSASIQALAEVISDYLTKQIRDEMYWHPWLVDMLVLFMTLPSIAADGLPDIQPKVINVARQMLLLPRNTAIFMRYATGVSDQIETVNAAAQALFMEAMVFGTPTDQLRILDNVSASIGWQVNRPEDEDSGWDSYVRMDPLKVANLVMRAIDGLEEHGLYPAIGTKNEEDMRRQIRCLWDSMMKGMKKMSAPVEVPDDEDEDKDADEQAETKDTADEADEPEKAAELPCLEIPKFPKDNLTLAKECLEWSAPAQTFDGGENEDRAFEEWAKAFDPEKSLYTDELIEQLSKFLDDNEAMKFIRVRRIRLLRPAEPVATEEPPVASDVADKDTHSEADTVFEGEIDVVRVAVPDTPDLEDLIPLAAGWQPIWSPTRMAYFYCNIETQEISWERPSEGHERPASPGA